MFLKDCDAVLDYGFDWTDAAGEAQIAESIWASEPLDEILTIDRTRVTDLTAFADIGGGTAGCVYRISNRVIFSDGRVDERSLALRVEER